MGKLGVRAPWLTAHVWTWWGVFRFSTGTRVRREIISTVIVVVLIIVSAVLNAFLNAPGAPLSPGQHQVCAGWRRRRRLTNELI